ncbi:Estradiol 17-beta-dehydrogenase [Entamoeba marina]
MNKLFNFILVVVGILINIVLVVPLILFVYRFFIRPLIYPRPATRYYVKGAYVVITGASAGVGRSFAKKFAEEGFNLILFARRKELLETLKTEIQSKYNVDVITRCMDLNNMNDELWNDVNTLFESHNTTILINNVSRSIKGIYDEMDLIEINRMVQLNISVPLKMSHLFINNIKNKNKSLIVFMSSCTSQTIAPYSAVYASTKLFVHQFSRSISYEYNNIDTTVFQPWHISTEMIGNLSPGFNVCTPDQFTTAAMKQIGLTKTIDPFWVHYFEDWSWQRLPSRLQGNLSMTEFKKFKELRSKNKIE